MPSVNIAPYIRNQWLGDTGVPLAGGLLYTYSAGTSTPKATYSDANGTTANANPVVLDSAGRLQLYLASGAYKFVLKTSAGVTVWTEDNVTTSTIVTEVDTVTAMAALVGGSSDIIRTLGRLSVNDRGGWWYYWNSASSATDDGGMVIQPGSLPATGRWIGLKPSDGLLNVRVYGAVCDGTTDDTTKIQACNTYCTANGCIILIDSSIYCATNPSLTAKIKLLPSVQFRYGNFNPTLDVIIDGNDKTQHFNCTASYVPTLNINEMYPEWFGETNTTEPITTAVVAALSGQKTKILKSVDINTSNGLLVSAGEYQTGIVLSNGYISLEVGADDNTSTRTDETAKRSVIAQPHYDNAEQPVALISGETLLEDNKIHIGGGPFSWLNGSTEILFYTSANNSTAMGTLRGYFSSDGIFHLEVGCAVAGEITTDSIVVGSPTGGSKGSGTINATAVYDDNVLLTGYVFDKAFNPEFDIEDWGNKNPSVKEFIDRNDLMFNLDDYCEFIKSRRMLPTFEDVESSGNIPSTGAMIQKLWEVVEIQSVHIWQLNERIKILENK